MTTQFWFKGRDDVDRVIDAMNEIIKTFRSASLSDFHDLVGLPSSYLQTSVGWTSTEGFEIVDLDEGVTLHLPKPTPIGPRLI